jgi:hypothetical protein
MAVKGQPIRASDYNTIFTKLYSVLGKVSTGYGAAPHSPSATTTGTIITATAWTEALAKDIVPAIIHQAGTSTFTATVTTGTIGTTKIGITTSTFGNTSADILLGMRVSGKGVGANAYVTGVTTGSGILNTASVTIVAYNVDVPDGARTDWIILDSTQDIVEQATISLLGSDFTLTNIDRITNTCTTYPQIPVNYLVTAVIPTHVLATNPFPAVNAAAKDILVSTANTGSVSGVLTFNADYSRIAGQNVVVSALGVNMISSTVNILYNNSSTVHPNQLVTTTTDQHTLLTIFTGTSKTHFETYSWDSADQISYFFNLGSTITPYISVTGPDVNANWLSLINQVNQVPFNKKKLTDPVYGSNTTTRITVGSYTATVNYTVVGATLTSGVTLNTATGVTATITILGSSTTTYSTSATGGLQPPLPSVMTGDVTVSPSPLPVFSFIPGGTSSTVITINNNSDSQITVNSISFLGYTTATGATLPLSIAQGGTSSPLNIEYYGNQIGSYSGIIRFSYTNTNNVPSVLDISARIQIGVGVSIAPSSYSASSSNILPISKSFTYSITGAAPTDPVDVYITTATNYAITSTAANEFTVIFYPPDDPGNYLNKAVVTVYPVSIPGSPPATAEALINYTTTFTNQHLGSWTSPTTYYGGQMAMSYDIIGGLKTLTIYAGAKYKPNYDGAWSPFLRSYGIWFGPYGSGSYRTWADSTTFYVPTTGTYTWQFSADNVGTFSIDGVVVGNQTWGGGYSTSLTGSVSLTAGSHIVSWNVYNGNGPGAIGLKISSASDVVFSTRAEDQVNGLYKEDHRWYWHDVYRIPFSSTGTYYAKNYYNGIQSYFDGIKTFGQHFGAIGSLNENSICTVYYDSGIANVVLNTVGSLTGDYNKNTQLNDCSFAFNYYDEVSNRADQLDPGPVNGNQTRLFQGFDASGNTLTGLTLYNPVPVYDYGGGDIGGLGDSGD